MTTLTVFLSGFVSSPEPENTTMTNLGGVIIGLYYHWYLLVLLSFLRGKHREVDTNKEKEGQVGISGSNMRLESKTG